MQCLQWDLAHLSNHPNSPRRNTWQEFAFGKNTLDHLSRIYFSLDKPVGITLSIMFLMMDATQSWDHDSAQRNCPGILRFCERTHDEAHCWSEIHNVRIHLINNWEQEYLGLLGHLYLYVVFQHGSFKWAFFACQTRIPKAHVPRDRAPSRSDIAFYDLTSAITLHHFCCILLVKAVTKVHLSSRRGYTDPTSQERNVNIPF